MSDLCTECLHRKPADKSGLKSLRVSGAPASVHAHINRKQTELAAARRTEKLAFDRRGVPMKLDRRPMDHDWCGAQYDSNEKAYYFCDWLTTRNCAFFQCSEEMAGCRRCKTAKGECKRRLNIEQPSVSPPSKHTQTSIAAAKMAIGPKAARTVALTVAESDDDWRLPLGQAYDLEPIARRLPGSLGSGGYVVDYALTELEERPAIRGKGLAQTYLIFGGPGSGKTFYFKYLVASLLAHPRRPGCLLLDPKGVLTEWLAKTLERMGRYNDLTVLSAATKENEFNTKSAFNVLGRDLKPGELGRLLSEIVMAGVSVDESWAVLISDLLEAAAVVIAADERDLTAATLLRDILYQKIFTFRDGKKVRQYPIVYRALRVGRETKDFDIRIACARISEFFESTKPEQRRYVRQIIERTLGELTLPVWLYLSSSRGSGSVYSDIIERGRVVSVAVGQSSPAFQRSLSALIKSLFQQAVLANLSARDPKDNKPVPFFILACDEYAQAITEGQTGLVSDSRFFSLSREAGCMSVLALQSMATGRSRFPAHMHDRWNGILGNVTVKLFMKANDTETAEMASALAGSQHSFIPVISQQMSATGMSATEAVTVVEGRRVPPWYLTNRMPQGYALVHGTLDGISAPTVLFVKVPVSQVVVSAT